MSENTYKWENSKKKTPEQNKNLVAWTKDEGLSQATRSKEGKWTLSHGRYTGKGSPKEGDSSGCNWAAYGLFGIPNGKGVFVMTGNEEGQEIFDYAPAQREEK